jgi:hypothetical protein
MIKTEFAAEIEETGSYVQLYIHGYRKRCHGADREAIHVNTTIAVFLHAFPV